VTKVLADYMHCGELPGKKPTPRIMEIINLQKKKKKKEKEKKWT
jgi:hypothetical protein